MRLKHFIPILALVAGCAAASPVELLTLDQAIELAVQNNRGLRNSGLDVEKSQDRFAATRTRMFPGVSLYVLGSKQLSPFEFTLEKGILGTYKDVGPLPSEDTHLTTETKFTGFMMARVSQPLTSLIRIRRSLDTLATGMEIAREQTKVDRQKLVRDVKKAYYSLQQVESALRTVRETAALYREIEKLTSNYVLQQVALRSDLLNMQTRVARTAQAEEELLDRAATGKEQLNQLLGRDILTEFGVQPVLEALNFVPVLAEARAKALEQRPEIRQAQLRQKQAGQDLRAKRAEYIPDVAAEFNGLTLLNFGRFLPLQSNSAGISLSWEPFDWGRKKHEIAEKKRTIEQTENQYRDAVNAVLLDVNSRERALRQSRSQLQVAMLAQQAAIESTRVVKNRYSVEAVLLKDVLQAQVGLEQTNSDYQQALVAFWNARAEFERALGEE